MSDVIAIDGPSASGKSSTAAAVAERLGYRHLDSGSLYRGLALAALESSLPEPWTGAGVVARGRGALLGMVPTDGGFSVVLGSRRPSDELRSPEVTARVSEVAAMPEVRDWVNVQLRHLASGSAGVVIDGRDIGTVVFPDARLKVFLTATPGARALRRLKQQGSEVDSGQLAAETERLARRDRADSGRAVAPLVQASDARVLDTSDLSFEDQVDRIVEWARSAEGSGA